MNDSGRSVRAAMDFFKKGPEDVTVFYDELDLAPFKVKVKVGGSRTQEAFFCRIAAAR